MAEIVIGTIFIEPIKKINECADFLKDYNNTENTAFNGIYDGKISVEAEDIFPSKDMEKMINAIEGLSSFKATAKYEDGQVEEFIYDFDKKKFDLTIIQEPRSR